MRYRGNESCCALASPAISMTPAASGAEPGTAAELSDKDGNKIGEATATKMVSHNHANG